MTWDIRGKLVLVTGAAGGIGLATSRELARRGAHVLAVGRTPERAERAIAAIREATPGALVDPLSCDLAAQSAVRRLAADVTERYGHLDVLVNNAGLVTFDRKVSADGLDTMLAVNHLAPFLLTTCLLPIMRMQPEARVVTVTSDQYKKVKEFSWAEVEAGTGGNALASYEQTKLMNVWFTRALAKRLAGSTVSALCVSPGFVRTGLARHAKGGFGFFIRYIAPLIQSTPEKGATTSVHACCSPDLSGVSGEYLSNSKIEKLTGLGTQAAQAERLWQVSEDLVGRKTRA